MDPDQRGPGGIPASQTLTDGHARRALGCHHLVSLDPARRLFRAGERHHRLLGPWAEPDADGHPGACVTANGQRLHGGPAGGLEVLPRMRQRALELRLRLSLLPVFRGPSRTLNGLGGTQQGYAKACLAGLHDWFHAALVAGGRGNEIVRVFNCQATAESTAGSVFSYCNANGQACGPDRHRTVFGRQIPPTRSAWTRSTPPLTAAQLADWRRCLAQLREFFYQTLLAALPGRGSRQQSLATGHTTSLGCYEGGLVGRWAMGGPFALTQERQAISAPVSPGGFTGLCWDTSRCSRVMA